MADVVRPDETPQWVQDYSLKVRDEGFCGYCWGTGTGARYVCDALPPKHAGSHRCGDAEYPPSEWIPCPYCQGMGWRPR